MRFIITSSCGRGSVRSTVHADGQGRRDGRDRARSFVRVYTNVQRCELHQRADSRPTLFEVPLTTIRFVRQFQPDVHQRHHRLRDARVSLPAARVRASEPVRFEEARLPAPAFDERVRVPAGGAVHVLDLRAVLRYGDSRVAAERMGGAQVERHFAHADARQWAQSPVLRRVQVVPEFEAVHQTRLDGTRRSARIVPARGALDGLQVLPRMGTQPRRRRHPGRARLLVQVYGKSARLPVSQRVARLRQNGTCARPCLIAHSESCCVLV